MGVVRMKHHGIALVFSTVVVACGGNAPATIAPGFPLTAVRLGALADGSGKRVRDAVVLVQGDRIVRVGSGNGAVPRGATVMDLRPLTGIPGMIDVHTHMTYWRDKARPNGAGAPRSKDSVVMFSAEN